LSPQLSRISAALATALVALTAATAAAAPAAQDQPPEQTLVVPEQSAPELPGEVMGASEGRAKAEGDEAFGEADAVGSYVFRTLFQTRVQETYTSIDPAVSALVRGQTSDPAVAAAALAYLGEARRHDDGFGLNRAFLRATAQPTAYFGVKLLIDFAELYRGKEKHALKLAFTELSPRPTVAFSVGLFKIPFSLLELLPIADYELAESGPTDHLLKSLGFAGRDIGAMVSLAPLHKKKLLRLHAGIFRGDANGAQGSRNPGILAGRATSKPMKHLRVGADVVWRPKATLDWEDTTVYHKYEAGKAVSADAIVDFKPVELRAEWVMGDRTDNELVVPLTLRRRGTARTFMSAWALLAARLPVGAMTLIPAARVEWLDTDRESSSGRIFSATAGLNLEVLPSVRLLVDLTRTVVQPFTYNLDEDGGVYDVNATTLIGQVQVKL
jgi:hypothetical protein